MEKLRLGVIGVGSVVREIYQYLYFASAYTPLILVEAVAEPDEAVRKDFCTKYGIPASRQFSDYQEMIRSCDLDAVHVNTPDTLHEDPTVSALEKGLDVLVPKPLAHNVESAHRMREAAVQNGRLLGVDFHKRGDPRVIEARRRYREGRYGTFQYAHWEMMDRLLVADPNREPPFFATPDFAEQNSPVSFLTVHMADTFMQVVNLRPVSVRAQGWCQKLPSLRPKPVNGYDMCNTEVVFENNGVANFVTGWHWPDQAPGLSNEWKRMICTDGVLDIPHTTGLYEITASGVEDPDILFETTDSQGNVSGFGISVPGELLRKCKEYRENRLSSEEITELVDPMTVGFWTTAVAQAAHESLAKGKETSNGVTLGKPVDVAELLTERIGDDATKYQ